MKANELTLNCDGICKKRKPISQLMTLSLGKNKHKIEVKLHLCKTCLKGARQLTIKDFELY